MEKKDFKRRPMKRRTKVFFVLLSFFVWLLLVFGFLNLIGSNAVGIVVKNKANQIKSSRALLANKGNAKNIEIIKDKNGYWNVINKRDKDNKYRELKILQLTDIHIGGGFMSIQKDRNAVEACLSMIEYAKPDLIFITGDALYPIPVQAGSINNLKTGKYFFDMLDNVKIPWAFVYGNHDTESFATNDKKDLNKELESREYNPEKGHYCLYQKGPDFKLINEVPMGNYPIIVRDNHKDGKIISAYFFMDSNRYFKQKGKSFSFFAYDNIHDDQVEWYIETLKKISKDSGLPDGQYITSSLFCHIPLKVYRTAWELFLSKNNNGQVKYFGGDVQEKSKDPNAIIISHPEIESKMFQAILDMDSTKYIFVGHDHDNNFSIEYKGVRLTYSKTIDYLAYIGISQRTFQRGGTIITQKLDGSLGIYQKKLINVKNDKITDMNTEKTEIEDVINN